MKKKLLAVLLAMSILGTPAVFNSEADVPFSVNAEAAEYKKLDKPASLKAKVSGKKITLSWKKVSGAEAYGVYKYDSAKKKYVKLKNVKTNKITVTADGAGTYKFKVYSLDKVNGKYKKGGSSIKSVKIAKSENVLDKAIDGLSLGMSKSELLKKLDKKDYFSSGDSYFVKTGNGDEFFCYQIENDKLKAYGVGYEYSSAKLKALRKLFEGDEWTCLNENPTEITRDNLTVEALVYLSKDKGATIIYQEGSDLIMAVVASM